MYNYIGREKLMKAKADKTKIIKHARFKSGKLILPVVEKQKV